MRGGGRRGIIIHEGAFNKIISLDNLFLAWEEFRAGKRWRRDVQEFERHLEDNIFKLNSELESGSYKHGSYCQFSITDPKPRRISKALVRDRLLHHAIYRVLYPAFDSTFIFDSYSCRNRKGTHKAFERLMYCCRKISQNYTKPCWALKCDIRKFFDSIDHQVLYELLEGRIEDRRLLSQLKGIIDSFEVVPGKGMPLGNLTSQLFANVYMDPLDKFVRHRLKVQNYLRYADDFLLLGNNQDELLGCFIEVNRFIKDRLRLAVHPDKIYLRKLEWGIDFVGHVARPHYSVPRKKTVKRMEKDLRRKSGLPLDEVNAILQSYLGYLKHANAYKAAERFRSYYY